MMRACPLLKGEAWGGIWSVCKTEKNRMNMGVYFRSRTRIPESLKQKELGNERPLGIISQKINHSILSAAYFQLSIDRKAEESHLLL